MSLKSQATTYNSVEENRRIFNQIWSQMPEMQKRTSSSWWFFILFPKDETGFGRRQLMFSIATRVGEQIRINDVWLPGLDLNREIKNGVDAFPAMVVGWYCDGRQVHDDIVKVKAIAKASLPERKIQCWAEPENGPRYGYEIRASTERDLALEAHIRGKKGTAHFQAWGDLDSLHSSPHESINIDTPIAGTHFIAWRRMNFKGEFDLPATGKETMAGICYFQRVCLNVPTFPWKWIWSLFPDGSMFSAYVPYLGQNLFRKGYQFFDSNKKEQRSISIGAAGFWDWPGPSEQITFNKAEITPVLGDTHPTFEVDVSNKKGDFVKFLADTYGHTRFWIDRPIWGGRKESHWTYNEYMFRMENLEGSVQGRKISRETMGQAFGSLEYTWGLGL